MRLVTWVASGGLLQASLTKLGLGSLLLAFSVNAPIAAQAKVRSDFSSDAAVARKTFRSPGREFSFVYRSNLVVCAEGSVEACNFGMLRSCDEDAIICVVYPAGAFQGTNFEGAGFEVRVTSQRDGPNPCGASPQDGNGSDGFQISAKHRYRRIGGVLFTHGIAADVAAGNTSGWDKYRVLHHGQCFELAIADSESTYANYDPGISKEFTGAMGRGVSSTLDAMLYSFRFAR